MNRGGGVAAQPAKEDCEFTLLLDSRHPCDDAELAELIELDGRSRLETGLPCDLARYCRAVPDLGSHPISLDAAIDVSLRSLCRRDGLHAPQVCHVEALVSAYPEFANSIRLAAVLGNQLLSTGGIAEIAPRRILIRLPYSMGQTLESGRPRYELVRELGEGSNGRVYEAVDHLLSDSGHPAKVAVKLISVDSASIHRQAAEATKARRIEHASVARVLDRGLTPDGELFLVYELLTGGDLHAWFDARGRRIELRQAVGLVIQIARGVQAAHSAGLVHCDLKPSNILLTPEGEPRVTDFGVAALTDGSEGANESDGESLPLGNLAFAAPEQVRRSVSAASPLVDVYAIGGLLWYLTTGQLPHGSTAAEVVRTHAIDSAELMDRPISSKRPDADERLDRICARAMRTRPEDRYPTAAEIAVDLEAWLEHRPIAWMKEGRFHRLRLWSRRSPRVAALGLLCLVLLIAGSFGSGFYAQSAHAASERALDAQWRNHLSSRIDKRVEFALGGEVTPNGWKRPSMEEIARLLKWAAQKVKEPRPAGWTPENAED